VDFFGVEQMGQLTPARFGEFWLRLFGYQNKFVEIPAIQR
jgi:hypothetical protein